MSMRGSPHGQANPGNMGQPAKNDSRALVICLLLDIWLRKPYRDMVSFLSELTHNPAEIQSCSIQRRGEGRRIKSD